MGLGLVEGSVVRFDERRLQLGRLHEGERIEYTGCSINCGGNSCLLKVRIKDNRITVIEPDNTYNPGVGIEDKVISDIDLIKNRLQHRGCPMVWAWHKHAYDPSRILYPLKRVDGTKRGEGKFERISWDEALTIIAEKMKSCKEKYGPYSIITPYQENLMLDPIFSFLKAGVQGWGWCSFDAERLVQHLMQGYPGWEPPIGYDMADQLLHSKMIVLWGLDPTVTRMGPSHQFAYYIKMARERGTPVISIEPRYTAAVEVLTDQWLPIKPGTDMAMMAAMAYILFKEDMYNHDFVEKYVEPKGFEIWRKYIMDEPKGTDNQYGDGVPKSPEWAEKICGVPAETIYEFTRLYARMKPTVLYKNWSVSRKSYGENSARAAFVLQAMMGYLGPGGYVPFSRDGTRVPMTRIGRYPLGFTQMKYVAPRMYRSTKWAQAVLLLDKVNSGEMSTNEYRKIIGWRTSPDLPNPNPKMLLGGCATHGFTSNPLVTSADSTDYQIKALGKMELVVSVVATMTPTAKYSDIILPATDEVIEEMRIGSHGQYGGFSNLTLTRLLLKPPGEAKHYVWIYTKLAEKLGFARLYNTFYTTDENWQADRERYCKGQYEQGSKELATQGITIPSWEEFKKKGIVNLDEYYDTPLHGYTKELNEGAPFPTKSGKIEFYSDLLADESQRGKLHFDHLGRLLDNLPNDWRELRPIPVYQPAEGGFEDARVSKYPLMLLTPHDRYRSHSAFWDNPWLRGDVYRHAAWINPADAKVRGMKDGDIVLVHNEYGCFTISAYVTERIMPGVLIIHHGGWYAPDASGLDRNGCVALVLHDEKSPVTPAHVTNLVQVEKYRAETTETSSTSGY